MQLRDFQDFETPQLAQAILDLEIYCSPSNIQITPDTSKVNPRPQMPIALQKELEEEMGGSLNTISPVGLPLPIGFQLRTPTFQTMLTDHYQPILGVLAVDELYSESLRKGAKALHNVLRAVAEGKLFDKGSAEERTLIQFQAIINALKAAHQSRIKRYGDMNRQLGESSDETGYPDYIDTAESRGISVSQQIEDGIATNAASLSDARRAIAHIDNHIAPMLEILCDKLHITPEKPGQGRI